MSDVQAVVALAVGIGIVAYVWFLWNDAKAMLIELDRK